MALVMAEVKIPFHGHIFNGQHLDVPFFHIFRNAAAGKDPKAKVMAHGVHDGAAAATFPFCHKGDVVGQHDIFKNSPGAAPFFPHDKILMPQILNRNAFPSGKWVPHPADDA